ncbi:arginine/serine-rich protein 1 isoform X2 [Lissotriton helveticus]
MAAMDGAERLQGNTFQQNCGQPSTSSSVVPAFGNINHDGRTLEVQHGESLYSISSPGWSKAKENLNVSTTEHEVKAKQRTTEMPNCLNELNRSKPKARSSRSRSRGSSCRSRSSSGSSMSRSRSRSSHSRSRSESRSSSRGRHYRKRRSHRSSRSSSRSRSRSVSPRYRRYHSSRYHRRYYRSPPRYRPRSRSRSRGRTYYRSYRSRSRSRSRSRGRRYYGFVRRSYPATFRSWRSRSRTRSRSRSHSPLRLTEKDRRELLEIAKANAAKALGKNVDLPPSLKTDPWFKEAQKRSIEADVAQFATQSSDLSEVPHEVSPRQGAILFNTNDSAAKPVAEKQCNSSTPKDEKRNSFGQWIPIQKEPENYLGLSPNTYMPIR